MKGFIEVTDTYGVKLLLNIEKINMIWIDSEILINGREYSFRLKESYEEIKELIKNAQ